MELIQIAKILEHHNVPYKVENQRIYADSMKAFSEMFEITIDLTDCTRTQLYDWLGY